MVDIPLVCCVWNEGRGGTWPFSFDYGSSAFLKDSLGTMVDQVVFYLLSIYEASLVPDGALLFSSIVANGQ
jgi:hypothetical protein